MAKDHNWIAVDDNTYTSTTGNGDDGSVATSTTPYYEEILPPYYSLVSNEHLKHNQEDLELQENTAYQITTLTSKEFELHENAAYCSVKS